MIVEDVTGILDPNKKYRNPHTGKVHTGERWLHIFRNRKYEHFYAADLRTLIEVKKDN